jgi:hypothetical protein
MIVTRTLSVLLLLAGGVMFGQRGDAIAQAIAPDAAAPPSGSGQTNMVEVERFVSEVYLDDGTRGTITTPFAEKVLYYGKWRTRAQLISDKQAYYARWPERRYTLDPASLRVERSTATPGGMDLAFEYAFAVSAATRQAQGRGRARLTIVKDGDGIAIVREEGEVIRR